MATKSLKQLQFEERRKKVKVNKLESQLKKEKSALDAITKAMPAAKKIADAAKAKTTVKRKPAKKR